jgi:cation diffusion facilitator family transporter
MAMPKNNPKFKTAISAVYLSIIGNLTLAISKGIAGYTGNSFALIADAIESSTDVFASLLVLFGLRYASKPPDENHPYGHGKIEPLITFAVVGFLLISATVIFVESIDNIMIPHEIPEPYTLYILGVIIIIKETFYRYVNKRSNETNSTALKADAWHHRSDAITSLMAFVGISISLYFGPGYETADDYAAMIASLFIVYNAFLIFRPALGEIMDEHLHDDLLFDIRTYSKEVTGVITTEKCLIRKMGMHFIIDLHVVVRSELSVGEGHAIAHSVKDKLMQEIPDILDVLVHIEPEEIKPSAYYNQ